MNLLINLIVAIIRAYIFTAVIVTIYGAIAVLLVIVFGLGLSKPLIDGGLYLAAVLFVGVFIVNAVLQEK